MTARAGDDLLSFAQLVSELVAEAELLGRLVPGFVAPPAAVRRRIADLGDVGEAAARTSYGALVALRVPLLLLPDAEFPRDPETLRRHVAGDRAAAEQARRRMPEQRAPALPRIRTIDDVTDPAEPAELRLARLALDPRTDDKDPPEGTRHALALLRPAA